MIRSLTVVAALALTAGTALAAPLNLVPPAVPNKTDVTGTFISAQYNATTHLLSISGMTAGAVVPPNTMISNFSSFGTWTLTATINNDGTIGGGGVANLLLTGPFPGPGSSNLMTSTTLSQFGFTLGGVAGGGATLEFVFNPAGGTLNPTNAPIGVIFRNSTLAATDFSESFSSSIASTADAFLVPTPATAVLGLGGVALAGRRRRR